MADAVGALGRATRRRRRRRLQADAADVASPSRPPATTTPATSPRPRVEDEESILTECVQARVPRQWLSWHYRSQDESLIAFSNAAVLREPAVVVPGADARAGVVGAGRPRRLAGAGARHVPPLGRRAAAAHQPDRGARRSSRRSAGGSTPSPGRRAPSIGVVTFNAQQRAYIEALLRDADDDRLAAGAGPHRRRGPVRQEPGERAGRRARRRPLLHRLLRRTPTGTLPLNFGPLNRVGGERRLNVAITRARRQVVVFSSFDPEQLRAEETSSVGIKHLRAYLDMAAQGTDVLPRDAAVGVGRRPAPRGDRRRAARRAGSSVRTDVGLSEFRVDLSVARPVDPDDAGDGGAARRPGVGAPRHGRRPRRPAGRGARRDAALAGGRAGVAAVVAGRPPTPWSTGWSPPSDAAPRRRRSPRRSPLPTAAVESFKGVAALRSSVTASVAVPAAAAPRPSPKPRRPASRAGPAALDGETPFVPWIPKTAGEKAVLDELPASKAARVVRRVLTAGIKAEGPIHVDRLAKLTVGAFGLNRVDRGAQGRAAVAAAAVGRGGRLPVARGRSTRSVDRVPPPGVERPTGRWSTWRRRRSATRWWRCAARRPGMRPRRAAHRRRRRCSATSAGPPR